MSNQKYHYVRCTVTGNALAKSSSKGTESVKIALASVPKDSEPSRNLWADLWLTEKTIDRTIETLEKALGWQGNSFAELNEPVLAGIEVVAVCEWEQDDHGRDREKVAFLNSTAGAGVKKAEDGEAKQIASKMDGFLRMARQNNPNAVKPTAKPRPKADDGQDYHY